MRKFMFVTAAMASIIIYSCSRKNLPAASDSKTVPVTTYSGAVKELIVAKCAPCHVPGGNKTMLDTYATTKKLADDIIRRIELNPGERGYMPFKKPKLSAEEIAVFKKWRDEGLAE